jgi:2-hydroxy-3-keto-5-methylthiopentenyl-1-phosphate phosphatase
MSAAKHADLLFVKLLENGESDLARYCDNLGLPYVKFRTFKDVLPVVKSVVLGEKKVEEVLGKVGAA